MCLPIYQRVDEDNGKTDFIHVLDLRNCGKVKYEDASGKESAEPLPSSKKVERAETGDCTDYCRGICGCSRVNIS